MRVPFVTDANHDLVQPRGWIIVFAVMMGWVIAAGLVLIVAAAVRLLLW